MAKKRTATVAAITVSLSVLVALVAANLAAPDTQVEDQIRTSSGLHSPQFRREMGVLLGPAIRDGNAVKALQNGDEIFAAMLEAIAGAEQTITFETYVYSGGKVGQQFGGALAERARAGVRVHVLVDWAGSLKADEALLDQVEEAGAEVHRYRPLAWYTLNRVNNRTHRKLLVVDGRVGFTSGVAIADVWAGNAQDPDHWRDIHLRVEGPVVAQV